MQATSYNPTPTAGFAPVTPIGDQPILSLVPPVAHDGGVRHPDPIAPQLGEQQPLPTSQSVPVAPVRRRRPVTPLIQLPLGGSIQAALQVAPLIPGQQLQQPQIQPTPAAYGVQPTTFPFASAPAFNLMPQFYGMMPTPLPMQTFVAYVTLIPQQPQFGYAQWPQPYPPQYPGY